MCTGYIIPLVCCVQTLQSCGVLQDTTYRFGATSLVISHSSWRALQVWEYSFSFSQIFYAKFAKNIKMFSAIRSLKKMSPVVQAVRTMAGAGTYPFLKLILDVWRSPQLWAVLSLMSECTLWGERGGGERRWNCLFLLPVANPLVALLYNLRGVAMYKRWGTAPDSALAVACSSRTTTAETSTLLFSCAAEVRHGDHFLTLVLESNTTLHPFSGVGVQHSIIVAYELWSFFVEVQSSKANQSALDMATFS